MSGTPDDPGAVPSAADAVGAATPPQTEEEASKSDAGQTLEAVAQTLDIGTVIVDGIAGLFEGLSS